MDKFQSLLQFFINQRTTIGYGFMAVLTIGGERVFTLVSFQCPCNHQQNFVYGIIFLLGPAGVLLVLGFLMSTQFWRLYTGCCLNPIKLCPRGNCCACFRALVGIFAGACVAPIMFLSVALLNGTFYECAISGVNQNLLVDLFCHNKTVSCREELARVPCGRSKLSTDEQKDLLLMLRAQSQILGWSIIIISATLSLICTCYKNCLSKVSYLQLTFWKRYMEKEKECFDAESLKQATKLANRNVDSFFQNKEPDPMSFPSHRAWEEISAYYTFSRSEEYYSTLQRFVEKSDRDYSTERTPVLDPEDGFAMS